MARQNKRYVRVAERRGEIVPPEDSRVYAVHTERGQAEANAVAWGYVFDRAWNDYCLLCERPILTQPEENIRLSFHKRHTGYIGEVCVTCLLMGAEEAFDRVTLRLLHPDPPWPENSWGGPEKHFHRLRLLREALSLSRAW